MSASDDYRVAWVIYNKNDGEGCIDALVQRLSFVPGVYTTKYWDVKNSNSRF